MDSNLFNYLSRDIAWAESRGQGVKVAVVDSGVDSSHPVFEGGCVKGGVVVEPPEEDGDPRFLPYQGQDTFGHGTACAGIIHEIAPDADLYSIQVLGTQLSGKAATFLSGLKWAIDNGMHVVNLSLGTTNKDYSEDFHRLLDEAYHKNCILVAAANNDPTPSIPSILAPIISVEAIATDDPFEFNFRSDNVIQVTARGIYIRVPWLNQGYMMMIGNSFAAPHVTGIVARILSKHPGMSPFEMLTVIKNLANNAGVSAQTAEAKNG